jgi:hypothetical protein
VVSVDVPALRSPPTASISSTISRDERRVVPLKAMCSSRCEMPCSFGFSSRPPTPVHTPSAAVSRCGMVSVTTVRPEGSLVTSTLIRQLLASRRG